MRTRGAAWGVRWLLVLVAACSGAVPIVHAPSAVHAVDGVEEAMVRAGRRSQATAAIRRRSGTAKPLPVPAAPLRARLQAAGLAATVQRQQVLALLSAGDRAPISDRDIYRRLDYAVSQVTIQRVLGQFESAGLIERVARAAGGCRPVRQGYRLRA